METLKCRAVGSVLTEKALEAVVRNAGYGDWTILGCEVKVAGQGLSGFLGDHFRLVVHLERDVPTKLHLFAKVLPLMNEPKAEFIKEYNFFKRENLLYTLFEEMGVANEPTAWCPKAFLHTDSIIVMPDLSLEGYKSIPNLECLDLKHVSLVASSLARFHASFACYDAKRDVQRRRPNSFFHDHIDVLTESPHFNGPWTDAWTRAAAKLSFNLLREFSTRAVEEDLEEKIADLFFSACKDLIPVRDSLNVIIHRDLWLNNIFFRHRDGEPVDVVLLDFQCARYAPPAVDLVSFLYLTTSRDFRESHEREIFDRYYTVFTQHLDDTVKGKLKVYNYERWQFLESCERARMFAMMQTMAIFPFVLMRPSVAQSTFDNPDTFVTLMEEDRSRPVLEYARECRVYRERQLQVTEEFVERYILKLS